MKLNKNEEGRKNNRVSSAHMMQKIYDERKYNLFSQKCFGGIEMHTKKHKIENNGGRESYPLPRGSHAPAPEGVIPPPRGSHTPAPSESCPRPRECRETVSSQRHDGTFRTIYLDVLELSFKNQKNKLGGGGGIE